MLTIFAWAFSRSQDMTSCRYLYILPTKVNPPYSISLLGHTQPSVVQWGLGTVTNCSPVAVVGAVSIAL